MNKIELLKNHIKEVIHNRFLGNPGQDIEINIVEDAIKEFDNFVEAQQDLIKGKDEYIAKLIDDNKKAKDIFVEMVTAKDKLNAEINNKKEELKKELNQFKEMHEVVLQDARQKQTANIYLGTFARIIAAHTKTCGEDYISIHIVCDKGEKDYPILKKVVSEYESK